MCECVCVWASHPHYRCLLPCTVGYSVLARGGLTWCWDRPPPLEPRRWTRWRETLPVRARAQPRGQRHDGHRRAAGASRCCVRARGTWAPGTRDAGLRPQWTRLVALQADVAPLNPKEPEAQTGRGWEGRAEPRTPGGGTPWSHLTLCPSRQGTPPQTPGPGPPCLRRGPALQPHAPPGRPATPSPPASRRLSRPRPAPTPRAPPLSTLYTNLAA